MLSDEAKRLRATPLEIPTTCIYSRLDGIVAWECCTSLPAPTTENVEVRSTHLGYGHNLEALERVIAEHLPENEHFFPEDQITDRSHMESARVRNVVLAVNKWDGLDTDKRKWVRDMVEFKLPFLDYVPVDFISALHGSGLKELMQHVVAGYEATTREMATPELNRVLIAAVEKHAPHAILGRRIKLRYCHQSGRNPPAIMIHGNQTDKLKDSYVSYLANTFREAFKLQGVPLKLEFKTGEFIQAAASGLKRSSLDQYLKDTRFAADIEKRPHPTFLHVLAKLQWSLGEKEEAVATAVRAAELAKSPEFLKSGFPAAPYDRFAEAIRRIGLFVPLLLVPQMLLVCHWPARPVQQI